MSLPCQASVMPSREDDRDLQLCKQGHDLQLPYPWVRDLETAPRLDARDLHALAAGAFQFLYDHGHGRDDGAYGQRETPHSLLALGIADVMQPGLLDRGAIHAGR